MEQYLRLVQHTLRHAAYRLGGAPGLHPGGGPAAAVAGSLLRLLHTAALGTSQPPLPAAATARLQSTSAGSAADLAAGGLPPGRGRRVAVGVSGGVDSAVAALLLKRAGYDVVGVFMRNWDEGEEKGNQNCSVERDLRDAAAVCRQLSIPLHEADFVAAYWNQVFTGFLAQCGRGLSPNPDLPCNRHIKFDALLRFADGLGAELVATGHYAQLAPAADGAAAAAAAAAARAASAGTAADAAAAAAAGTLPRLLRGADRHKDQTYFLASVQAAALRRVLFPVGHLQKGEVRQLAAEAGLLPADKRSSAGICFIGRRNFAEFLGQYLPPLPGRFVDVDTARDLGPCPDLAAVTHGQRPGIGGAADRVYAVGKDLVERVVYVASGRDHPALRCSTALLRAPHWLSPAHAARLAADGSLRCQYKARYGQQPRDCTLYPVDAQAAAAAAQAAAAAAAGAADGSAAAGDEPGPGSQPPAAVAPAAAGPAEAAAARLGFRPSAYCRLQAADSCTEPGFLVARFHEPAAAITPQQAFVLYDGEQCLGTALIAQPGRSLHEEAAGAADGDGGDGARLQLQPAAAA